MQLTGSIIVEVTRWCNLECKHCLRGDRQRIRQKYDYMYSFLGNFEYVDTVTFTGGEPTLAPNVIGQFIDASRNLGVNIGNYYIATNANRITQKFLDVWERLHHWCDDNEISSVDISNDRWHDNRNKHKIIDFAEYRDLPWHYKYPTQYKPDYATVMSEGRAKVWGTDKHPEKTPFLYRLDDDRINYIEGELYLNCKGNVIHGCDWSFKSQDKKENIIAHVFDFEPEMLLKLGRAED